MEEFTVNKRQKTDNKMAIYENNKLSEYLFNIVSIHLIHKQPIEKVFELSLISKSTFKTIQNLLVSYELNRYKFIISVPTLIKYIELSSGNQDNYKYKLIQYKELERIKVPSIIELGFSKHVSNYSEKENKNELIKKQLIENCPKLKKVVLLNKVICKTDIGYDYTCDGFFKVKKLWMHWDYEDFPYTKEEAEVFDHDMDVFEETVHHEFSFSFLLKYNPTTYYITTSLNEYGLNMQNLTNIFKCKSIKSFVFKNHRTPPQFFTNVFEQINSVSRLSVILNDQTGEKVEDEDEEEKDDDEKNKDEEDDGEGKDKKLSKSESISSLLSKVDIGSNKTLKKLKLNRWVDDDQYEIQFNQKSLPDIFKQLNGNKSLKSIGLQAFNITDETMLSPLCNLPNIQTLYVIINERDALTAVLNHLNQNPNITKLRLVILNDINSISEDQVEYNDIFSNYFNDNVKSSLCSLVIKYYEHFKSNNKKEPHPILKILENSKTGSSINLKLKFQLV